MLMMKMMTICRAPIWPCCDNLLIALNVTITTIFLNFFPYFLQTPSCVLDSNNFQHFILVLITLFYASVTFLHLFFLKFLNNYTQTLLHIYFTNCWSWLGVPFPRSFLTPPLFTLIHPLNSLSLPVCVCVFSVLWSAILSGGRIFSS